MARYNFGDKVIFNGKEVEISKVITNYSSKKSLYELTTGDIVEGDLLSLPVKEAYKKETNEAYEAKIEDLEGHEGIEEEKPLSKKKKSRK